MFRRSSSRTASSTPSPPASSPSVADGSEAGSGLHRGSDPGSLVTELRDAGWVLPRGVRRRRELDEVGSRGAEPVAGVRPGRVEWSLVGTVSSPVATPVDGAGLVVGEGWSLDWWIGADDRWRIPAREGSIRQFLLGDAPVVETLMRVPGGGGGASGLWGAFAPPGGRRVGSCRGREPHRHPVRHRSGDPSIRG
jgi:hypothetical protein